MQLQPDTLLQSRYRILGLIAQGGMGAVYRARDERLGSTVALKQTLMADPTLRAAFEREARLLAALQHPALPVVSDHFSEGGGQFLVMQYIPGDDLAAMLKARGGPFPPDQVLAWADEVLDALAYLHAQRPPVIHRDIKPQNLKLAPHGGVVLLDFGLAKGLGAGSTGPSPSLFGYTPQYAPIEQIQGAGTDARSDLYSLAATLVELLSGSPPPDALTRLAATAAGQPDPLRPVLEIQPKMPPSAADALTRALSLNAALRPPTAESMRADLRRPAPAPVADAPQGGPATVPPAHPQASVAPRPATGPTIAVGAAAGAAPPPAPIVAGPRLSLPRGGVKSLLLLVAGFLVLTLLLLTAVLSLVSPASSVVVVPTIPPIVIADPDGGQAGASASAPALPGASFADPVAYGRDGAFGPLTVRVLDSVRGREAWNLMYRANQFNDPAPAGSEYLLVQLAVEAAAPLDSLYPRLAGERGVLYASTGVSPAELPDEFGSGQRVEAWVSFLVAEGEGDLVLMVDTVSSEPDLPPLFLAADEGARREVDPALEQIIPNEVGASHADPAPLGETAVAEDYTLTVLEARRGPAVLEELVARYDAVERPREGYEYALVHLRVRFIGDGRVIGWANVGSTDVAALSASAADPQADAIEHPRVYVLPDELTPLDFNLLAGGEAAGWTVLELPIGVEDMALVFSPGFDPAGLNTRYLALE
jgi:hypothetical protein